MSVLLTVNIVAQPSTEQFW